MALSAFIILCRLTFLYFNPHPIADIKLVSIVVILTNYNKALLFLVTSAMFSICRSEMIA